MFVAISSGIFIKSEIIYNDVIMLFSFVCIQSIVHFIKVLVPYLKRKCEKLYELEKEKRENSSNPDSKVLKLDVKVYKAKYLNLQLIHSIDIKVVLTLCIHVYN